MFECYSPRNYKLTLIITTMIYKVKRFSTINQKEFGWIRNKLSKTISEEEQKKQDYMLDHEINPRIMNLEVEDKMINENKSTSVVVPKPDKKSPRVSFPNKLRSKNIKGALSDPENNFSEDDIKLLTLVMTREDKNISTVYWDRCDGLEELAHEFGHVNNYNGNFLDKFINRGAKFSGKIKNLPDGVINSLLSVLGSTLINWEESNASKKGYEMLKKYNLSPKDLRLAKENLDNALKIYKSNSKIEWRRKLINSKIPQWLL